MRVWRLASPAYARALDGEGNRQSGARWNSPGRGVVYTGVNLAVCVLETFVHMPFELRQRLPLMSAVLIDCPDDAGIVLGRAEFNALAGDTDPKRREAAMRGFGDEWLSAGEKLWLQAPSVIVPQDMNVMLNPAHPRFSEVRIVSEETFQFDSRLSTS
jgi:RES domain-containing protein